MALPDALTRGVGAELALQQGRLILWAPVWFAVGIGLYFSLPVEPPQGFVYICAILAAGWGMLAVHFWRRSPLGHALGLVLSWSALLLSGFGAAQWRTVSIGTVFVDSQVKAQPLKGTIRSLERLAPGQGARVLLEDVRMEGFAPDRTPGLVRLRVRKEPEILMPGMRVAARAGLSAPAAPAMPGAYDFARDAYFKGIGASGFVYGGMEVLEEGRASGKSLSVLLEAARQKIVLQTQKHLDPPVAGMVATYLTGEGSTIAPEDWQAMRTAGLAHLLAISGMNVGIVAGLVFFVVRLAMAAVPPLALRWPIKKIAAGIAFVAALAYVLLVGAQIPAQRALLMTGIALLAVMLDRSPLSMRLLCVSALAVLALRPESLLGASFQMSFAAVAALIFAYEQNRKRLSDLYSRSGWLRRSLLYLAGVCATTLVASAATAPFSAFHFQQFSVYGIAANLIGVPVMSFIIMPGAILSYLLMPLGLERIALELVACGVWLTLRTAHAVSALPGAFAELAAWPLGALVLVVLGAVWAMLWQGWGRVLAIMPVAGALLWVVVGSPRPDLMISDSGKLIAVRDRDTLAISTRRSDRFERDIWQRRMGGSAITLSDWPREGVTGSAGQEGGASIGCDAAACRIVLRHRKISYIRRPEALETECRWASIALIDFPRRHWRCPVDTVVWLWEDSRTLGAQTFYFPDDPDQALIRETVQSYRGARPWSVPRRQEGIQPALRTSFRPFTKSE